MSKVLGKRKRPRVALLGVFSETVEKECASMFPTLYIAKTPDKLLLQVDPIELDLLIVNGSNTNLQNWNFQHHLICFSAVFGLVPGPTPNRFLRYSFENITTQECEIPSGIPLSIHRLLMADLRSFKGIRGWNTIETLSSTEEVLDSSHQEYRDFEEDEEDNEADNVLNKSCLLKSKSIDQCVICMLRAANGKMVCLLQGNEFDRMRWIRGLLDCWSNEDPIAFADFTNFTTRREWLTQEEIELLNRIEKLDGKKAKIDRESLQLEQELLSKVSNTNRGVRRLLSSCGDELVEVVIEALQTLGFIVDNVDTLLEPGVLRREDLRLRAIEDEKWEAIVEVRGYGKSAGKTSDLLRLERFASMYEREKGRLPSRRYYIVNGPTDLDVVLRDIPLKTSEEDVVAFAEVDGCIISTADLFRALKLESNEARTTTRQSIINAGSRWQYSSDQPE